MSEKFKFEGTEYRLDELSDKGRELLKHLSFIHGKLQTLRAKKALLNRARNGYIEDIKAEIIEKRSGIDLGELFSAD